jgi:hypothetical protein
MVIYCNLSYNIGPRMERQAALVQNVLKLLFFEKIPTNSTPKA